MVDILHLQPSCTLTGQRTTTLKSNISYPNMPVQSIGFSVNKIRLITFRCLNSNVCAIHCHNAMRENMIFLKFCCHLVTSDSVIGKDINFGASWLLFHKYWYCTFAYAKCICSFSYPPLVSQIIQCKRHLSFN